MKRSKKVYFITGENEKRDLNRDSLDFGEEDLAADISTTPARLAQAPITTELHVQKDSHQHQNNHSSYNIVINEK